MDHVSLELQHDALVVRMLLFKCLPCGGIFLSGVLDYAELLLKLCNINFYDFRLILWGTDAVG